MMELSADFSFALLDDKNDEEEEVNRYMHTFCARSVDIGNHKVRMES